MKHLTMSELENMGFELVKSYTHDEYMTQRRKKGVITVETTWLQTGEFQTQDLTIDEIWIDGFGKNDLLMLDKILNKNE